MVDGSLVVLQLLKYSVTVDIDELTKAGEVVCAEAVSMLATKTAATADLIVNAAVVEM